MRTETRRRTEPAKRPRKADGTEAAPIKTLTGRFVWHQGRPALTWETEGHPRTVSPDRAQMAPHLREPRTGEAAVSFELADGAPVHIRAAGEPWRVLISILGGTPAVITETLQQLLFKSQFVPDRIVVFTTTAGRRGLDDVFDNNLRALCAQYTVPVPDYRPIELLTDAAGAPLSDIRSDADNIAAANVIANRVRELTRFPESVIHASVAGGRKTMGTLLSDAISLFGRAADTVSHVLVQPEAAEFARNFYYRPQIPFLLLDRDGRPVRDREGRELTSDDVQLDLASKPFFRLRGLVAEPLLADPKTPIDFAAVTSAVNVAVNRPKLIVHGPESGEIEIADFKRIKLDPTHYALFRVIAEATTGALGGLEISGSLTAGDFQSLATAHDPPEDEIQLRACLRPAALRYLDMLRQLRYPGETWTAFRGSEFWRTDRKRPGTGTALWRISEYQKGMRYINPILSHLEDALAGRLGSSVVARLYGIDRQESEPVRFRLACGSELIDLRD